MTILDFERGEKKCPVCNKARLLFITDAPKIRPAGKTVEYRCRDCAVREAKEASDPITMRQSVEPTWNADRIVVYRKGRRAKSDQDPAASGV